MNIISEHPAIYDRKIKSKIVDNDGPVPALEFGADYAAVVATPRKCIGPRIGEGS